MISGAFVVGPPAAGKSSLIDELHFTWLDTASSDDVARLVAGEGSSESGGAFSSAASYEALREGLQQKVLGLCRGLAAEGMVVELGGPLGLWLTSEERVRAVCLLPGLAVLEGRLRRRHQEDPGALRWLASGGWELVGQWHRRFAEAGFGLGTHLETHSAVVRLREALA